MENTSRSCLFISFVKSAELVVFSRPKLVLLVAKQAANRRLIEIRALSDLHLLKAEIRKL